MRILKLTIIFLLISLLLPLFGANKETIAASYDVIPLPQKISRNAKQQFVLDKETIICYHTKDEKKSAEALKGYLREEVGLELVLSSERKPKNAIILKISKRSNKPESYKITIDNNQIVIEGADDAGLFYGIQTLRKSIITKSHAKKVVFEGVVIEDYPRFAYRGMMLDVSRHFSSADFVKKYIDLLALHNINTLHLHLTEDQGWRIEIKKYPKLNEIGSYRKETICDFITGKYDGIPHGGYYTQEELRDFVRYARERHIEIIPEVDLPGHMLAALASYPELGCTGGPYEVATKWGIFSDVLCAGNENVYKFLEDVLTEVIDIFPSKYIHIGGDECLKSKWEKCPKCQHKIAELGFETDSLSSAESKLQSYLTNRIAKFINSKGREVIGWDEIVDGGKVPNATVMSWRGEKGGVKAAKMGNDVIMVPNTYLYFDYYQTPNTITEPQAFPDTNPIEDVYNYDPVPKTLTQEEQKRVLGVQANLWAEMIPNSKHAEYMTLPRLAALSEIQWASPSEKDFGRFLDRLQYLTVKYTDLGYNFSRAAFEPMAKIEEDKVNSTLKLTLSTADNAPIFYTTDETEPTTNSKKYNSPIIADTYMNIKARAFREVEETNTNLYTEELNIHKGIFKDITLISEPSKYFNPPKGKDVLLDGQSGNGAHIFGDGTDWIGFGKKMEVVIDLRELTEIHAVLTSVLLYPKPEKAQYRVSLSDDNIVFEEVLDITVEAVGQDVFIAQFDDKKTRFVKVEVVADGSGFVLSDEIIIR